MKSLFSLMLILGLFFRCTSQTAFNPTVLSSAEEEIPICLQQIGSLVFGSIRTAHEPLGIWNGTRFIRWDSSGRLTGEIDYDIVDSSYYCITNILPLNLSEFLVIGKSKSVNQDMGNITMLLMDTSLTIHWEKKYFTDTPLIGFPAAIFENDSTVIIGTTCETYLPEWYKKLLFLKIGTDGDSIQAKYNTNGHPDFTFLFSLLPMEGQYKAFVEGFSGYVPFQGFSEVLQLDPDFNMVGLKTAPYWLEPYMKAEKINESKYVLAGMAYSSSTHYDVGVAILSSDEDSIAYNHAGGPGTAIDYSGWRNCMSKANSNSIYVGGTGNDNGLFYSCYTPQKVIMLSNYDSMLNCRWTRFYGSDTACYILSTLEATSDGGCIMGGMFCTPSRPENLLDALIIKLDSLGVYTDYDHPESVRVHDAIVYPNPGNSQITIQSGPQISDAAFCLYTANGKRAAKLILHSVVEQMDVSRLAPGAYPWQVIFEGKVIDQGVWTKY